MFGGRRILAGAVLVGASTFCAVPVALADTCDPYTGVCEVSGGLIGNGVTQPLSGGTTTGVGGATGVGGTTSVGGTTEAPAVGETGGQALPFTGGEFVLALAVGLGAVGAGTVLVVAARRRNQLSV